MAIRNLGRRAVVGGAAMAAATPVFGAGATDPVRIAVLTDENGPYTDSGGAGNITAARMAAQDFGGVVLGRKIEILHADTQNKPDVAGSIARAWYDSGVDAIIDLPVTPVAAAVQQIAREKGRTIMITASAVSEFTSKNCAPISSHWADDTHALTTGVAKLMTSPNSRTWFFITVNFSFGEALEAQTAQAIEASGGKVIGDVKFPIGNTEFSSQILAAQNSGASIIGIAAVGGDQVNLIKQAAEFGLRKGGVQLAGYLIYITDIHALGLDVAQGLSFPASFYWDQNDDSRAFSQRFMMERKAAPTKNQAVNYASSLHFLKAMAQAGTDDPIAVNKAMRAMPVSYFGRPATLRADGRLLYDVTLYRVKRPDESHGPWDYYTAVGTLPAVEAFLPMNPACG
ncbi:MAG: branched-chain amino acid transport system substrate-binding protein [Acetobacteraceae bacterium]|jgi:branched-chain amino acid transport system substrate-binding protein|nr:branched-chain amino acid transport system substrate-binding protein [Acetobacteraceae bacterium]